MEFARSVIDFFVCLAKFAVGLVGWTIVEIINEALAIFGWFGTIISYFIPGLDFQPVVIPSDVLSYINWIFPLGYLSQLYAYALTAFAIYRVMRWAANRAKIPVQPRLFD